MVVDYEAAWHKLGELIAAKSQHGREPTLVAMQEIARDCRVPEGELPRLFRLYGVEVEQARRITEVRDDHADLAVGDASAADDEVPGCHRTEEVHDGARSNHREGAAVG